MSPIVVKTAKRNTSATRSAIREAVNEAYEKIGANHSGKKTDTKPASKKTATKH